MMNFIIFSDFIVIAVLIRKQTQNYQYSPIFYNQKIVYL